MKKIKAILFALVLIAGFANAFASHAPKAKFVSYWFSVDASGNPSTLITNIATVCPDASGPLCGKQYDAADTQGTGSTRTVKPASYPNYTAQAHKN
jgi:hypothetical protein